jgi:hypothetical protein
MQIATQWYTLIVCAVLCGLTGVSVWRYAYRLGVKHGRSMLVPFPLIDELIEHRIACLGQDPTKAQVAVETSLGLEE